MSYDRMDHAGWVQTNYCDPKMRMANKKQKHPPPETLNRFQAKVMDICGITFGGIYNAPIVWDQVEWHPEHVMVPVSHGHLATFDFMNLTTLVALCHIARIRGSVDHRARGFRITFYRRSHEGGGMDRHPDLAEMVRGFAERFPPDHPLHYQPELDDPSPERLPGQIERQLTSAAKWIQEAAEARTSGNPNRAVRDLDDAAGCVERAIKMAKRLPQGVDAYAARIANLEASIEAERALLAQDVPA